MLDRNATVKTIQPYTVNSSMKYFRNPEYLDLGVSHLYSFENHNESYRVVSDACADIMIYISRDREDIGLDLVGPHDNLETLMLKKGYTYLGICFLPGYSPFICGEGLYNIKGKKESLNADAKYKKLICRLRRAEDVDRQVEETMKFLLACSEKAEFKTETSREIIAGDILDLIIKGDRNYSLKELETYSGYSARYLNKIFREHTGYSICEFSNVLRVQKVANCLDMCRVSNVTPSFDVIALDMGFSDQSHMIREFKKKFGMTPNVYYQNYC